MLLDYENQRPMEVEVILGNLIKIAKKHQLELPVSFMLFSMLKAKEDINLN